MNTYSKLLSKSITEIEDFSTSSEGAKFDVAWYADIKKSIIKAAKASKDLHAEEIMKSIGRTITDSGPLTGSFAPSLDSALDAAYRKHRLKK